MKKQNGITLIALVITIIVMLILVGVTITMALNGGLFGYAKEGVAKTGSAKDEESEIESGNIVEQWVNETGGTGSGGGEITASDIAAAPNTYYGATVTNYTCNYTGNDISWRVFYADSNNIYLIASNLVQTAPNIDGTSYLKALNLNDALAGEGTALWNRWFPELAFDSSFDAKRAVAYLLDTTQWNTIYCNNTYAEFAIGGPPIRMFLESYNTTHETQFECSYNEKANCYDLAPHNYYDYVKFPNEDGFDGLYIVRSGRNFIVNYWLTGIASFDLNTLYWVSGKRRSKQL